MELGWKNPFTPETFGADSDEVSVWELTGLLLVGFRRRFELRVVVHANVAQFLSSLRRQ